MQCDKQQIMNPLPNTPHKSPHPPTASLQTPRTTKQKSQLPSQPLILIPESGISIFPDCLCYNYKPVNKLTQIRTSDTDDPKNEYKMQQKQQQEVQPICIMFSNADLAFKIQQPTKTIQIHNIIHHATVLKFQILSQQTMLSVQSLLRKKMCELGFDKKYKILQPLGKGATAQVYLVMRISDNKHFAAKIISLKQANDKSYQTFVNESKLLRMLRHKNILHLQSVYIQKKQLIQVMQYYQGGTLLQMLTNNPPVKSVQKWKILRDLANAIQYLRQRRIVHRDLKLENILIRNTTNGKEFVLSDFGLACWTGQQNPLFQRCGTPGYIAPQVLNAEKGKPVLDHKCDVFSYGSIAHVIFMQKSLFPYNGNVKELLKANKRAQINFEDVSYKYISLNQMAFLEMTLAKDPQKRVTSIQILQELKYQLGPEIQTGSPRKTQRSNKLQISSSKEGVKTQIKKATSLTKKKIDLSSNKTERPQSSGKKQQKGEKPLVVARNLLSEMWSTITRSSKKQTIKIKENSIQKHKKMKEFIK